MSTPFPLEEQSQTQKIEPSWNPWQGKPEPSWYSGMGFNEDTAYLGPFYRALEGTGQGTAKGETLFAGLMHAPLSPDTSEMVSAGLSNEQIASATKQAREMQERGADAIAADAQERVRATTPDPATTGTAAQLINGLSSGLSRVTTGALIGGPLAGASFLGGSEAASRYAELREQGVDSGTASASAGVAGVTSAAGALIPGGFGSALLTKVLTGAGSNLGLGFAGRYADHALLESAGYKEMADQQKVWDTTQVLTDSLLGAAFGGLAHLHSPTVRADARDAALTTNLALRDRAAAPGVAVDPQAAAAHQAALEKATSDLLQGKPVDVSGTGVDRAEFLSRPPPEDATARDMLLHSLKEAGFLDEEANLRDLEAQLAERRGETTESVKPTAREKAPAYSVQEEALTDEQREKFQGLRSDIQADEDVGGSGGGVPERRGSEDDGGPGSGTDQSEPLTVYRGGRGGPLTPEHFDPESLGKATGHPSSGLGVYFTNDAEDAARYGTVTAHHLDIRNPKVFGPGELPGFDTLADATKFREELKAQGHDGVTLDYSSVGGPVQHVAFEPKQVIPAGEAKTVAGDPVSQALADRPDLEIPGENGEPVKAADALEAAKPETDWFTATKAATDCFSRRGR